MGIHLAEQTMAFIHACLLGACLGILYDIFRILRIAFPTPSGIIFLQDVLFFVLCAISLFFFLLTTQDGQVRMFSIIGALIGGILYHFTIGQLVMKVSAAIINAVKAVLRFIFRYILMPIWKCFYAIISLLLRPVRFIAHFIRKTFQKYKFRLKIRRVVLYNQFVDFFSKKHAKRPKSVKKSHKGKGKRAKEKKEP